MVSRRASTSGPRPWRCPNDRAEFERWAAPYLPTMTAIARHYVNVLDVRGTVGNAIRQAWKRRESSSRFRTPNAWLAAITLDRATRRRTFSWLMRGSGLPVLQAEALFTTTRLDVEWTVRQLPLIERQLIVLCYLAELPITDAAHALRIDVDAAVSRLHQARRRLCEIAGGQPSEQEDSTWQGVLREWGAQARAVSSSR